MITKNILPEMNIGLAGHVDAQPFYWSNWSKNAGEKALYQSKVKSEESNCG